MNKLLITLIVVTSIGTLYAEDNRTVDKNSSSTQEERTAKQLEKQINREKKFAKEQKFYKGKNHDLAYAEVNKESIDSIPLIEPDYDFDMDDVYD
jgi:hypothetical protein